MLFKRTLLVASLLCGTSAHVYANPEGGVVVVGNATIVESGKKLDVHQQTDRAVIDWRSFDVEVDEHTQFHQPSSSATAVNRVNSVDPSRVLGKLTANGNVVLINPNGVFFGKDSVVDVNGIVATSANISNEKVMAGGALNFDRPGHKNAAIVNAGTITAKEAGLVGLVAPVVENHGVIIAKEGRVHLASGDTATVDFYGDGLMEVAVNTSLDAQAVINTGRIENGGGTIALTAAAGKEIVDGLIVASGELKAPAVKKEGGKIIIFAEGSNAVKGNVAENKGKKLGATTVLTDAYIDVSGRVKGAKGGSVEILGDKIVILPGAIIDASGDQGGGDIKIGGNYLGKGTTAAAQEVYVDQETLIANEAITKGNGGRTIIWSDDTTEFHGNIFARGGVEGGDGGFVETSGKENLKADGHVDLRAQHESGDKGTYLLDPADITIYGNVDPNFVSTDSSINLPTNLALWLDADDPTTVTLTYSTTGTTAGGAVGTNTITTAGNVSAYLQAGARVRLGAFGAVTTADTIGADTYTIASISGTTITTVETLTSTYVASTLNKGLVSAWGDKAPVASNATQTSAARRPLYLSSESSYGGAGAVRFYRSLVNYMNLSPDLNNAPGGYNSIFYTMNWGGSGGMPFGFTTYDLYFAGTGFGVNNGAGNVYGVASAPLLNTSHQLSVDFFNGVITGNQIAIDGADQTETFRSGGAGGAKNVTDAMRLGSWVNNTSYTLNNIMSEIIILNKQATLNERNLLEQYQSVKSGLNLAPPGTGATEAAKAMATDGYGVFTTRYLEKLSATADIALQATNSITLDLKGDALTLTDDRNISMTTTTGDITDVSAGSIVTNRTGAGGNISMSAGGDINLDTTLLNAQNGGEVSLAATGDIDLVNAGALTLDTVTGTNVDIRTTGANDITLNNTVTSTASGNSLVLASGRNLVNNAGAAALNAGAGRWLTYSADPTADTKGGLSPDFKRYNRTFAGNAPAIIAETGNGLMYSIVPNLTITADNKARAQGGADPTFTYTPTGLIDGDTKASALTGLPIYTVAATLTSPVGSYSITPTLGALSSIGYSFTFVDGVLNVTVGLGSGGLPATVAQVSQSVAWNNPLEQKEQGAGSFKIVDEPFYDTFSDEGYFLSIDPRLKVVLALK